MWQALLSYYPAPELAGVDDDTWLVEFQQRLEGVTEWVEACPILEELVGRFQDWQPAPRRQHVIILSGLLESGLGDGSKHVF